VVFALEDQVQRYYKAVTANTLNCCSLFPIARLKNLTSALSISTYNNHATIDNAHYKASFVEVVEVHVLDPILLLHIVHQLELHVYKLRIFAKGLLLVIGTR